MSSDFTLSDTKNALILTVNSRLSLHLFSQLEAEEQNKPVTITPTILPLTSWIRETFSARNTEGLVLLSDFQEHCLWEKIIRNTQSGPELLQPMQTAQLIKQAWRFLIEWEVPLDSLKEYDIQLETQHLITWIDEFKTQCTKNAWVTTAELPKLIAQSDQQTALPLPSLIKLAGFDDFTPIYQSLFKQLATHTTISQITLNAPNANAKKVFFADNEAELKAMAEWTKIQWQKNPTEKIACVIPDLQKQKSIVRRIFTQVFAIGNILPSNTAKPPPFNISAGQPLDQHPMIKTALLLLQWPIHPLAMDSISGLLQSPYLALNETEASMGALIDAKLRESNQLTIQPADLFETMSGLQGVYPNTTWLTRWRAWIETTKDMPKKQLPSQWAKQMICNLSALKWPGQHTQDSVTYQYLERFKKLMQTFSQLDLLYRSITFNKAFRLLVTLTKQTIFQPKSHQEPIQIMGVLEAAGLPFTKLWVTGLHNGIWPAPTKPNPFIPFAIQQQYQMPHATAARELHFCEQVTNRLKQSAQQVVFSIPLQQGDQLLQPTRLLDDIETVNESLLNAETKETNPLLRLWQSKEMMHFSSDDAPAVQNKSDIRGGATILKLQATCPFKAFASLRLKATPLGTPQMGIDGATRGTLAHQVLFFLWGKINDLTALSLLSDEELGQLIDSSITQASREFTTQQIKQKSHYFWEIEKKRLKQLITEWMVLEKKRPYFKVAQRETPTHITLAGLPLKLRIDRVDELADGSQLLIDYKTGLSTVTHWFQARISDPQLPLYAAFTQTTSDTPYTGLAFAQVRNGALTFKGVVSETHEYTKHPTQGFNSVQRTKNSLGIYHWDGLQQHWQTALTQLAKDFCAGVATVDPINAQACQFCELQGLCRI